MSQPRPKIVQSTATQNPTSGLVSVTYPTSKSLIQYDGIENVTACCCGDPLELPFPDDHFDLVIVNGVLEYVPLAVPERLAEAQLLGVSRRTLINKIEAFGIERPRKGKK